jgi:hypothetical protein
MIKISTKKLFKQIEFYDLSREEAWDKAIELGWSWNVLEGIWVKNDE